MAQTLEMDWIKAKSDKAWVNSLAFDSLRKIEEEIDSREC
jgi:hypothetical protein